MTGTLNPTITITISGPTGSGKSRILALINDVLKLSCSDCIIDAPQLQTEMKLNGGDHTSWPRPRSGTVFQLEENNKTNMQAAARNLVQSGSIEPMSKEGIMDVFRGYGFKDKHGHNLESYTAFHALVEAATTPRQMISQNVVPATTRITADHFCERPVPVHIQRILARMGISITHYVETDLQPLIDLVNWALQATVDRPLKSVHAATRSDLANQLMDVMEPHCKTDEEEKVIAAAVLALFTTISPALVARELRHIIGN